MVKRRLPRGARRWFVFETLWRSFDVVLANARICPDLKGRFGVTDTDRGVIWLDESVPRKVLIVTFFHEAKHALMSTPGEDNVLACLLGCPKPDANEREELFVTHLAPKEADAFMRSGLLSFPPIPEKKTAR